jgi:hypothetical protein
MEVNLMGYVDKEKLNKIPKGQVFESTDVFEDDINKNKNNRLGKVFKKEVKSGLYNAKNIGKSETNHQIYEKQ